jgi:hypothetical protein
LLATQIKDRNDFDRLSLAAGSRRFSNIAINLPAQERVACRAMRPAPKNDSAAQTMPRLRVGTTWKRLFGVRPDEDGLSSVHCVVVASQCAAQATHSTLSTTLTDQCWQNRCDWPL